MKINFDVGITLEFGPEETGFDQQTKDKISAKFGQLRDNMKYELEQYVINLTSNNDPVKAFDRAKVI